MVAGMRRFRPSAFLQRRLPSPQGRGAQTIKTWELDILRQLPSAKDFNIDPIIYLTGSSMRQAASIGVHYATASPAFSIVSNADNLA